jgi:hypothetical protein
MMALNSMFPAINQHWTRNATDYWPSQMAFVNDFQIIDGYHDISANGYYKSYHLTPWYCYLIQGLIALLFLVCAYFHFQQWKAENAGEEAKGIWGYQTWAALFFFVAFALLPATTSSGYYGYWVPLFLGIIVAYLISLCIFQRKIKLNKASLILASLVIVSGTVTGFVLTYLSWVAEK